MLITEISPYLRDNFSPVQAEVTADDLPVIGELPQELSGIFIRNGPNPQFPPLNRYHWFDGDGMLHGIQISNGKAAYRNRYVQTQGFKLERNAGRAIWTSLMAPPQLNNPYGPFKNTANTALVLHAGRLLALWEGGDPYEIEVPGLKTLGPYTYGGKLVSAFTAHPKIDAITGEMMFFGCSLAVPPYLRYSVVSAQGKLLQTVPIDLPTGVMIHDFAITEHYTLLMDLPLTFRSERLRRGEPAYLFEPDLPSRFGILPRYGDSSKIRWFEFPSCYVLHTLNAYEVEEEVVLIACRMTGTTFLNIPSKPYNSKGDIPRLHCWRFNLRTGKAQEEALDDVASEFPSVNQQRLGQQNRYGYTARIVPGPMPLKDGLLKYDFISNFSQTHYFGPGRYGGEAVFVPRPHGTAEDDGWLLTFVYDTTTSTSELVLVNAQDLTVEPVARILIPQRVPYGFHGIWIAEEIAG